MWFFLRNSTTWLSTACIELDWRPSEVRRTRTERLLLYVLTYQWSINSDSCWGQNYKPNDPNTKEYSSTCCMPCQPGEYLNKHVNSCVNCEAGQACSSTLRKNSTVLMMETVLINNSKLFVWGKFYSSNNTNEECRRGFYSPGSATQCTSKLIINHSQCLSCPDKVKSDISFHLFGIQGRFKLQMN